jgi:hypothetical protein
MILLISLLFVLKTNYTTHCVKGYQHMYPMLLSYCYGWVTFLFGFLAISFKGLKKKRGWKFHVKIPTLLQWISLQIWL